MPISETLSFPPENIAISGNRKHGLITDGGKSSLIAIINFKTLTANTFDPGESWFAQAVAIAGNKTAIFADYDQGLIFYGKINKMKNGFESLQTIALCDERQYDNATDCEGPAGWPVNVTISPGGKTALVAPAWDGDTAFSQPLQAGTPHADGLMPDQLSQINIKGPGRVEFVAARYTLLNSCTALLYGVDTLNIHKNTVLLGNDATGPWDGIDTPYKNLYSNNVVYIDLATGILTLIELANYGIGTGVAIKP